MALDTAVSALADRAKAPGDARTMDQRRADVLGDLAATVLDHHELPTKHRRRPHLQVTVAASTLAGVDDQPGELAGYGPIPAELARRIAADATWRRILTDPVSGVLLDYGTTMYTPPRGLVDHVLARDQTCQWPGCRQPAVRCDLDHRVAFPAGSTCAANLHALCRRHHRAKTEAGWTYRLDADNNLVWTSPNGHTSTRERPTMLGQPPPAAPPRKPPPLLDAVAQEADEPPPF